MYEILLGIILVAMLVTLVRPGSNGPTLVTNITHGFASVVKTAISG